MALAAKLPQRAPLGTSRSRPRNQLGCSRRRTPKTARGGDRHLHRRHQLAERLPLRDAAGERHEEQDHDEEPDQPEQALDDQGGRALDRLPRQPDGLVEAPRVESHRARRDDAEVAADEVRAVEEADTSCRCPARRAGSASARRWRRCRSASRGWRRGTRARRSASRGRGSPPTARRAPPARAGIPAGGRTPAAARRRAATGWNSPLAERARRPVVMPPSPQWRPGLKRR